MSDYRVSYADLRGLASAIKRLNSDIRGIQGNITSLDSNMQIMRTEVQEKVADVDEKLTELKKLFDDEKFVAAARHELEQLSKDVANKFGHYKKVRNSAIGILQATDVEFIRNNAIKVVTEELFLGTPNYWLVPALLALAFWIEDNQDSANKAVKEAIVRDHIKTSLFFALISRRSGRLLACKAWLSRYFNLQSPSELSSETIVVLDALTIGAFGIESGQECMETAIKWRKAINCDPPQKATEIARWKSVLMLKREPLSLENKSQYKMLQEYSPNWKALESSLEDHHIHQKLYGMFSGIMDAEVVIQTKIKEAIDDLLMSLVTDYDAEELPFRREIRKCTLKVKYASDYKAHWEAEEEVHQATCQFGGLLKNLFMRSVVMDSKQISVSNSTQKVAVALAKDWIAGAHQEIVSSQLESLPDQISIKIDTWEGETREGDNEEELLKSLTEYLNNREQEELLKNKRSGLTTGFAIACVLIPIWMRFESLKAFFSGNGELQVGLILGGIALAAGTLGLSKFNLKLNKEKIEADYKKKWEEYSGILKATIAEAFNYREEIAQHQASSKKFFEFISNLDVRQYLATTYNNVRQLMMSN
ncbi:hypothetical protein CSB45_13670 [candidate division KSB3 bacterium]|uniref:Uncharacterized protein n=1 Tax=candidate division KSB3 bacterium TaxID=2044937 RepID=A0A2G6E221_9BACT|nr:MAG: hypothetical protein CSB45_13670 [candidate division KSB3 bacterium]PIE28608.1 MAG: hypothetical protein CSA57_13320 [candidate division KSB3 bacterium]